MSTFEISTCFMGEASTLDAQVIADAVAQHTDQEAGSARYNGGALFALETAEVFFGTRRAHTNVHVTVRDVTFAQAQAIRAAISEATGRGWNAPTQNPDDVEKELDGAKSWSVFTAEGARAVQAVVDGLEAELRDGTLSPVKLWAELEKREQPLFALAPGYGDTEPGAEVRSYLRGVCRELGVDLVSSAW